jgi:hypothetical protein
VLVHVQVSVVTAIWAVHMVVVILTDLLVLYAPHVDFRALLMVCQMIFIFYGLIVSAGFAYVAVHMAKNLRSSAKFVQGLLSFYASSFARSFSKVCFLSMLHHSLVHFSPALMFNE